MDRKKSEKLNIGKIWQKVKDLYGWDKSQLFYMKDKRAYYGAIAKGYKREMLNAKNTKAYKRAKWNYERYIEQFDRADFYVRHHDHNATEEGWREK